MKKVILAVTLTLVSIPSFASSWLNPKLSAEKAIADCGMQTNQTLRQTLGKRMYALPNPDTGVSGAFNCLTDKGYWPIVQEAHPDYWDSIFCGVSDGRYGIPLVQDCVNRG